MPHISFSCPITLARYSSMMASGRDERRHPSPSLSLFFSFPFLATPWHVELLDQGSDSSLGHDLRHSSGNTPSLTHCAGWDGTCVPELPKHHQSHCVPQQELPCLASLKKTVLSQVFRKLPTRGLKPMKCLHQGQAITDNPATVLPTYWLDPWLD